MSVVPDAVATAVTVFNTGTSATNTTLTVTPGITNGAVLGLLIAQANPPIGPTMSWDGVAMTLVASFEDGTTHLNQYIFGIINPNTGNKVLSATFAGAVGYLDCASFSGVDQTGGTTSFPHGTSNNGNSAGNTSAAVSSAIGNYCIATHCSNPGGFTGTSGTTIYTDNTGSIGNGAANYDVGAATVTLTAAHGGTNAWSAVGVDILAAGGGGGLVAIDSLGQTIFRRRNQPWAW